MNGAVLVCTGIQFTRSVEASTTYYDREAPATFKANWPLTWAAGDRVAAKLREGSDHCRPAANSAATVNRIVDDRVDAGNGSDDGGLAPGGKM